MPVQRFQDVADRGWRGGGAGPLPKSCFEKKPPQETDVLPFEAESCDAAPAHVARLHAKEQDAVRQQSAQGSAFQQERDEPATQAPAQRTSSAPPRVLRVECPEVRGCPSRRLDHRWPLRAAGKAEGHLASARTATPRTDLKLLQLSPAVSSPEPIAAQARPSLSVSSSTPQDSPYLQRDSPPSCTPPESSPMKRLSSAPPKSPTHNSLCGSDATTDISVEVQFNNLAMQPPVLHAALRSSSPQMSTAGSQVHSACNISTSALGHLTHPQSSTGEEDQTHLGVARALSPTHKAEQPVQPQTPPPPFTQRALSVPGEAGVSAASCTRSQQKLLPSELAARLILQARTEPSSVSASSVPCVVAMSPAAETPPHPRLPCTARTATSPLRSPRRSVPPGSATHPAISSTPQHPCPSPAQLPVQAVHVHGHQPVLGSGRPSIAGSMTMPAAGPVTANTQGKRSSSVTGPTPSPAVGHSAKVPVRPSSISGSCQTPPAGPGPAALGASSATAARYAILSGWVGNAPVPGKAATPSAASPSEATSLSSTSNQSSSPWAYPQALGSQANPRSFQVVGQGAASVKRLPGRSKAANNRRTSWKGGTARSCAPRALAPSADDDESVLTSECISIQQKLGKLRNKTTIAL